ncbi:MAG: glycosyltransferase family 39 protein [Hyphomicrobiales bacterium]|nr:glycosyltransferase family 39 protein [Hyphomicrobiales bacterium]
MPNPADQGNLDDKGMPNLWARVSRYLGSVTADRVGPYFFLALLFCTSIAFRPVLPIDETRYLSVSWEMLLKGSYVVPTMNFEPYFHKPPLLFWLIDLSWSIFGVGRVAALLVIFLASCLFIYLTMRLARALFPDAGELHRRIPWLVLGNVAFIIYSSLILFDILLTDCILASFLLLLMFAKGGGRRYALLAGVFIGLGVLAKGPVILIHIGWPIVLYPIWRDRGRELPPGRFYRGALISLLAALVVVLLWLAPVVAHMGDAIYRLIWNQSAGRITGTLRNAHDRPIYFYLLLLPVMALPWLLSPELWRSVSRVRSEGRNLVSADRRALRLLLSWSVGVFVTFSLISGKQPHYLVPLIPLVTVGIGYFLASAPLAPIRNCTVILLVVVGIGQAVASQTLFRRYDLQPLANYIAGRRDADWAFAGDYQDQFGFLARLEKPLAEIDNRKVEEWLASHPNGYVVATFKKKPKASDGVEFSIRTERGYFGVMKAGNHGAGT